MLETLQTPDETSYRSAGFGGTLSPRMFEGAGFVVSQTRRKTGWRIQFLVTHQPA
jgi:hypothetical protein